MNKKGFAGIGIIIVIVLAVAAIGGGIYFVNNVRTFVNNVHTVANPIRQTNNPPITNTQNQTLSQLLSSSETSREFLAELQRLNPKLDINKANLVYSDPITSTKKLTVMPDSNDPKWTFSPNSKNAFFDSGCFKEGDRETLDVITTANGKTEIETILDWGTACPNGNGFWLSDAKLAYLRTYNYTQIEPESANRTPASTSAVTIYIFDLTNNIAGTYYVNISPEVIVWPYVSSISISSDGKSIIDSKGITLLSKGNIFLNMEEMLPSGQFVSFAKENNFRRYDDPAHSSFLKIISLSQSVHMVSGCLNCNEDLYSYDFSFIFDATDKTLRFFHGRAPRFSNDGNLVILRVWGDAEVTAFAENIYDVAAAKLIGTLSSRGEISDFAKEALNITADTFVTFDFSPDSKSIIITPQVYDGNNYRPFASKLMSGLDGTNLRVVQ